MKAFFTGLSALTHPAAWSAIALLLLNDHVFKRYFPSALTGKISDFAGLLFFPLLLSALIGLLEKRPRRAAVWGFALTGLVFAALKLSPPVASWASAALGRLLGANVWITPDPTDLSALVMLIPAGLLWRGAPDRHFNPRVGYAALVIGALSSVATSPCPTPMLITRLAQTDSLIYAGGAGGTIYQSIDGGLTWTNSELVPEAQQAVLQTAAELPLMACEHANPLRCYRIGVKDLAVEFSADGGEIWRLDWHIPAGRLTFMNRSRSGILACEREVIGGPYDLLIDPQGAVVVAMGNEGVLVGSAGSWQRIAVGRTSGPTPFREDIFDAPFVVLWEVLASILAAYIFWIGLTFWAGRQATLGKGGGWFFALWWGLLFAFLFVVYLFFDATLMNQVEPLLVFGLFGLAVLLIPPITWWLASRKVTRPGAFRRAGISAFGWSLVFLLALGVPFVAWAMGFPPYYWLAVLIALGPGIWVGQKGARSVARQVRESMMLRSVVEGSSPVE